MEEIDERINWIHTRHHLGHEGTDKEEEESNYDYKYYYYY